MTSTQLKAKYPRWHKNKVRRRRARRKQKKTAALRKPKARKRRPGLLEMLANELQSNVPPRGYKRMNFRYRPPREPRPDMFGVDI